MDQRHRTLKSYLDRLEKNFVDLTNAITNISSETPIEKWTPEGPSRRTGPSDPTLAQVVSLESELERQVANLTTIVFNLYAISDFLEPDERLEVVLHAWKARTEGKKRPAVLTYAWKVNIQDSAHIVRACIQHIYSGWLDRRNNEAHDNDELDATLTMLVGDIRQLEERTFKAARKFTGKPIPTCKCGCKRRVDNPNQTHAACRKRKSRGAV